MRRDFLDALQQIALAAEAEEREFRREAQRRTAELAAARINAYRRLTVLRAMVEAASAGAEREAALAAQIARVAALSGWSESDAGWRDFCAGLSPVAAAIHADLHGPTQDEAAAETEARSVTQAFLAFESWYRGHYGTEFLALLEQSPAFQPAVDF